MVDIGLERATTMSLVRVTLAALLPGLTLCVTGEDYSNFEKADVQVIVYHFPEAEFRTGLTLYAGIESGDPMEWWLRSMAYHLGIALNTRAWCDGTGFGQWDSPYWTLIWDAGALYLADDSEMTTLDDPDNPAFRIIRRLPAQEVIAALPSPRGAVKNNTSPPDR